MEFRLQFLHKANCQKYQNAAVQAMHSEFWTKNDAGAWKKTIHRVFG